LTNIQLGGRRGNLHFIRFPTSQMMNFIDLCVMRNLHTLTFKIFATGGGAYKFEKDIVEVSETYILWKNKKSKRFLLFRN
jgi:type II pantothenate kinase